MNMQEKAKPKIKPKEKPIIEKKKTVGRPTAYSEDMQEKADEFLEKPLFETYQKEVVVKDQIQVINAERPGAMPSVAALSLHLNISRQTLYSWGEKHDLFLDTLEKLRQKQESFLEYHGLTRGYDSAFAKFIAVNVTNYRDKVESKEEVNTRIEMAYKVD